MTTRSSLSVAGGIASGGLSAKEAARSKEVEQQIAYLRWKKMQNDREIKKAITVSRALKKRDAVLNYSTDKAAERFNWANSVVHDELQRPLVISDAELHYIQHEEVKSKKKLEKYSQRHINVIDSTLEDLKKRQYHGEVARSTNEQKISLLQSLKEDVRQHMDTIKTAPPLIDTKAPLPKLFA